MPAAARPAAPVRTARRALTALASAVALLAACTSPPPAPSRYFGTLQTDPARAAQEHRLGLDTAHLELRWDLYEPREGVRDTRYVDAVRAQVRAFERAGSRIEAGLGLDHPPAWLAAAHPRTVYTDQYGDRAAQLPNLVFSRTARAAAGRYVAMVAADIGLHRFRAVRVGTDDDGEFGYPSPAAGRPGSYWAFDPAAQAAGADPERPASVPANPAPGWRPGEHTYQGRPFTAARVGTWTDWYLAALADAVNWQIGLYTALGFRGDLHVLVPGTGIRPWEYRDAVARHLDGTVEPRLMGLGVVFFRTIPLLRPGPRVRIVPTSLADGSGTPVDNGCDSTDRLVDVRTATAARAGSWSSVRWVAAVAHRSGLALGGETAGTHVSPYGPGVMDTVAHQITSCGLQGLMWAFDADLHPGTPGASLDDYAATAARLRAPADRR